MTRIDLRARLRERVAATYEADERLAAELCAKLPEAVRLIHASLGPRRVVLFGSLAMGTFVASRSDVDLAVDGIGPGAPDELLTKLRELFGRRVDVVDPKWCAPFVQAAITKGRVLSP
jgi:predicted nucleotidyltransferase